MAVIITAEGEIKRYNHFKNQMSGSIRAQFAVQVVQTLTWLLTGHVGAAGVAGLRLTLVHVTFQVADHVGLTGDGD